MREPRPQPPSTTHLFHRHRRLLTDDLLEECAASIHERLAVARAADDQGEAWRTALQSLEQTADDLLRLHRRQCALSKRGGALHRANMIWEGLLFTDEQEWLDLPETPPAMRARLHDQLRTVNTLTRLAQRTIHALAPSLRRLAARLQRPVRILEVGSGDGDLLTALARWTHAKGIPVELTGSDLHRATVDQARQKARDAGLPLRFEVLDALHMPDVPDDAYDLALCVQTVHHLTPGALARFFAETGRVAHNRLFIVDVARQPLSATGARLFFPLIFDEGLTHDAVISARRAYSRTSLRFLAMLALDARVEARWLPPIHSVLQTSPW